MADAELDAMGKISAALENLDENARERVIRWAKDRYGLTRSTSSGSGISTARGVLLQGDRVDNSFTDIASLYDAANPGTDSEKLLVAGYWFQVLGSESELDSLTLNSELKNLGHPIGNVTRAVSALAATSPRYVLQTKKTGSSKQARKKFRLTTEGIRRVEQMVAAGHRDGERALDRD